MKTGVNKGWAAAFALLAITCMVQTPARGQNAGSIRGVVTDPSAAVVPNATVVATGSVTRSVKTDNQGRYALPNLPAGKYKVEWHASCMSHHKTKGSFEFTVE